MKQKTVYILIDTSGSMHDTTEHTRASAVNQAMSQVMNEVLPRVLQEKDAELELSIAVLTFSSTKIEWHIPRTKMELVAGNWLDIDSESFYGGTPTGEAIKTVIDDMKTGCYGENNPDAVASAILLLSDGEPNGDNPTYEEVLQYADKENANYFPPFRYSNRIAIGIQVDEAGRESLKKFGRISSSIAESGHQAYYDCTDDDTQALIDVIKSCTLALSINS